jgi:hypothetical protein
MDQGECYLEQEQILLLKNIDNFQIVRTDITTQEH